MDDGAPPRKIKRFSADELSSSEDSTDDELCGGEGSEDSTNDELSGGEGSEDSTTDELSSSEDSTDDELYDVWWRHSGEAEIESIPEEAIPTRCEISKILEDIGDNEITHMLLLGTVPPSLHQTAPKLHSLKIQHLQDYTKLNRLATLTRLKELNLSRNDFSNGLPPVVGELSSLTVLELYVCKLTDLPDNLATLTQLKELDLSANNFSNGVPQVVGELSSLTILNLAEGEPIVLPDKLATLTQLKELNLSHRKFSNGLPQVIGELTSLTVLNLECCRLPDLPDNLATLTQLKELNLTGSRFSKGLPQVVGELSSLTVLHLAACKLTDLPDNALDDSNDLSKTIHFHIKFEDSLVIISAVHFPAVWRG